MHSPLNSTQVLLIIHFNFASSSRFSLLTPSVEIFGCRSRSTQRMRAPPHYTRRYTYTYSHVRGGERCVCANKVISSGRRKCLLPFYEPCLHSELDADADAGPPPVLGSSLACVAFSLFFQFACPTPNVTRLFRIRELVQ